MNTEEQLQLLFKTNSFDSDIICISKDLISSILYEFARYEDRISDLVVDLEDVEEFGELRTYNFPIGDVKFWSSNMELNTRLEKFIRQEARSMGIEVMIDCSLD